MSKTKEVVWWLMGEEGLLINDCKVERIKTTKFLHLS